MLTKIVSGGQTGADRAGLDVGRERGLQLGGWCPKGRKAEDGSIPLEYPLKETDSAEYPLRTRLNVRDSDGTLGLMRTKLGRGSRLTVDHAKKIHKPVLVVDLDGGADVAATRHWLLDSKIAVLNVTGSREGWGRIYVAAIEFLRRVVT